MEQISIDLSNIKIDSNIIVLNRVKNTPKIISEWRGKDRELHNPQIGSIITIRDNGYGNGYEYTAVVISIKNNKKGIVSSATISEIEWITDDQVAYNKNNNTNIIKPYFNKGYDRWSLTDSNKLLTYLVFDQYISKNFGYHK